MTVIQYHGRRDQEADTQPTSAPGQPSETAKTSLISPPSQDNAEVQSSLIIPFGSRILPPEDTIFLSYTHANLMDGREHYASLALEPNKGQLALKCYLALSTTYFGVEHRQPVLVRRGLNQYGKALTELNLALGNSSRCLSYDLLESVVVMAIFEASPAP